jgi:MFS family permease
MSGTIIKVTGKASRSNLKGLKLTIISKGRYLELVYLGLSLLVVSMGLLILFTAIATSSFVFIIIQILAGAATGIMYPPPLIALQTGIQTRDNAIATSTFGFIRQLSTAISVVLGGVVFQNGIESHSKSLQVEVGSVVASLFTGKEAAANVLLINSLGEAEKITVRKAFAERLKQMWILFACTDATGLRFSVFIKRRGLSRVHEVVKVGLPENTEGIILDDR